jgi:hypothetical protein
MKSPHRRGISAAAWLIATALFASCATHPPARDADDHTLDFRTDYLQTHPNGPFNRSIERGEITLGMGYEDVLASWGIPDARERSEAQWQERWTYTVTDPWNRDWVRYDIIFEKGALSTWEIMRNVSSSDAIARDESERVLPPPMPSTGGGLLGDARR